MKFSRYLILAVLAIAPIAGRGSAHVRGVALYPATPALLSVASVVPGAVCASLVHPNGLLLGVAPPLFHAPVISAANADPGPALQRAVALAANLSVEFSLRADQLYAKYYEGADFPADGEAVHPRVILGDATLRRPFQLALIESAVHRAMAALNESVALGRWNGPQTTLDEACCGDAAPKLAFLLRSQGVPAYLVEAELHYYVMVSFPNEQFVIDPSVRQFFGKKQAPRSIPKVFVGTIADLNSLFLRHASSKTTKYGVPQIYFQDAFARVNVQRAFEEGVRTGSAADFEPLRRFLAPLTVIQTLPGDSRPVVP